LSNFRSQAKSSKYFKIWTSPSKIYENFEEVLLTLPKDKITYGSLTGLYDV